MGSQFCWFIQSKIIHQKTIWSIFPLQQWQCVLLSTDGLNGMYPAATIICNEYRDDSKFDRIEYWAIGYRPFVKRKCVLFGHNSITGCTLSLVKLGNIMMVIS